MNVVYDCHIPEVMGYPECGYCFRCENDAFFMWDGYFSDLMDGMYAVYGRVFGPEEPGHPHLEQVPLLQQWNQDWIGSDGPWPIPELPATARAIRDAVAELLRAGPNLPESPQHGVALVAFLDLAVATGKPVSVEEWLGEVPR